MSRKPLNFQVRKQLLDFIQSYNDTEYAMLPPERELCLQFGVSRSTLRKSIAQLSAEGYINSIPGQGNLIRRTKSPVCVGIIQSTGERGIVFHLPQWQKLLSGLEKHTARIRPLTLYRTEEAIELCSHFHIDGLIWLEPLGEALDTIKALIKMAKFPVIAYGYHGSFPPGVDFRDYKNYYIRDYCDIGRKRAQHMIEQKATKIIYVGGVGPTYRCFQEGMAQAGFPQNPKWRIDGEFLIAQKLEKLLEKEEIDGIVSDGGYRYAQIFQFLNAHPQYKKISLLFDDTDYLRKTFHDFSDIPLPWIGCHVRTDRMEVISDHLFRMKPGDVFEPVIYKDFEIKKMELIEK